MKAGASAAAAEAGATRARFRSVALRAGTGGRLRLSQGLRHRHSAAESTDPTPHRIDNPSRSQRVSLVACNPRQFGNSFDNNILGGRVQKWISWSAAAAACIAGPAWAGDKVLTGPTPAWVAPAPAIDLDRLPSAEKALPLFDEQVRIDGDVVTAFFDTATLIASPEILAQRGTISFPWQPEHGDLTFHRIEILRGDRVIDALNGDAGFTVLRREAGLERLMVDGRLTAVKHVEGLQVGDVLRVALSVTTRDEVLDGNVQDAMLLMPSPARMGFGRARLVWPNDRPLAWKALMSGITASPKRVDAKWTELVVPLPVPRLPEMPKNMPVRFQPLPLIQFSSFSDWGTVAKVMAPLYSVKNAIEPGSDLAGRVDAIAAQSPDPVRRMADALRMVQDEVRYQMVSLGAGNYVPQAAAETWAKRYGDCKAKTLLLLAILDRLGIEAEPVLANSKRGDAVGEMLPSAMAFDHVLVRARAGGEDFWLDGTMLGSRLPDIRDVPRYGQVLPLLAKEPALVQLPLRAHARPDLQVDATYDMASGPHLPAAFRLHLRYSGPFAEASKVQQGVDYEERIAAFAAKAAKTWIGSETITRPHAEYDAEQAEWNLAIEGVASLDWEYRDGRYGLALAPTLIVAFDAPRDRASWREIPALIDQPWTAASHTVMMLPDGGKGSTLSGGEASRLELPAVEWQRSVKSAGGKIIENIISRESGAEIPADKVSSTAKVIADATGRKAHLELATTYPQRWDDVARMRTTPTVAKVRALFDERIAAKPEDAGRFAERAWFHERLFEWSEAEADYGRAIALDPTAARYVVRSALRASRGDHPGALKDAQAAYDLEEGNEDARLRLASELAENDRVDEALDLLPESPDVTTEEGLSDFLQRIDVLEAGGRHAEAIELLDTALERRGSSAELRNARCWYHGLRNSNLDAALDDCNRAIELSSNSAAYLDSRAMVHYRSGRLADARSDYEAAMASSPDLPSSLFMYGIVLAQTGEKEKAAVNKQAARVLFPDIDHFYERFGIKP